MPVITITSDFGWQDYYLAAIKGICFVKRLNILLLISPITLKATI
jgi:S-adenosylmethionine hydrolase